MKFIRRWPLGFEPRTGNYLARSTISLFRNTPRAAWICIQILNHSERTLSKKK